MPDAPDSGHSRPQLSCPTAHAVPKQHPGPGSEARDMTAAPPAAPTWDQGSHPRPLVVRGPSGEGPQVPGPSLWLGCPGRSKHRLSQGWQVDSLPLNPFGKQKMLYHIASAGKVSPRKTPVHCQAHLVVSCCCHRPQPVSPEGS